MLTPEPLFAAAFAGPRVPRWLVWSCGLFALVASLHARPARADVAQAVPAPQNAAPQPATDPVAQAPANPAAPSAAPQPATAPTTAQPALAATPPEPAKQAAELETPQQAALADDATSSDAPAPIVEPPHYLGLASLGIPLRLTVDEVLAQKRIAPAFGDVLLGYVLSGSGFRHGFGLGVSWNITRDGGYTEPIYGGDQLVLMPAYLAYDALSVDVIAIGHVGVPILVRGGAGAGLEVGAALAYRMFAGAGLFAELSLDAYGARKFNLLASLELGVLIDYEVLP